MNAVDLRNAFEPGRHADNFTVLLLRLIAKADGVNREKLRKGFRVEVRAVEIYKGDCPYMTDPDPSVLIDLGRSVDWDKIVERAVL